MSDEVPFLRHMPLLDKAFEPVRDYLDTTEPVEVVGSLDSKRFKPYYSPRVLALGGIRMRLDYELAAESINRQLPFHSPEDKEMTKHVSRLMTEQMKNDLADMMEDGDVDSDYFGLQAFDGAVKRGVDPKSVVIDEVSVFRYYAKKKDCYEYTVYATIYIEWG